MTNEPQSTLEDLLRSCELGWMIDWHSPSDQAIPYLQDALEKARVEAQQRFGSQQPQFTEDGLAAEFKSNPHKVKAFLQALGATQTPQMLVMVWRIMQGANIAAADLSYDAGRRFHLRIVLSDPFDRSQDGYETTDINDAALLRHFGITKVNGGPRFDGFYPLPIR